MTTDNKSDGPPASVASPVRPFSEIRVGDVAFAGGKGANLGELASAGFPVPPGFVIGAPAYAAFRGKSGVSGHLAAALKRLDVDDPAALEAASAEARAAIESTPMPDWLDAEVRVAYDELAAGDPEASMAVRSSATAEDTATASFAGMNETFLNVRGADEIIAAVRGCWASLFGARTVFYRGKRGFSQADMDIAVVVERQVTSTRAGVMFTIDPASGDRSHLVIEGSFGLGEAVVSGQVSPDRYVVEKESLAITTRAAARKDLAIEVVPDGGTTRRRLSAEEAIRPVLDDDEVRAVAELGLRVESHYGSPQDTEWAFDGEGQLWLLQSRPVTASGPLDAQRPAPEEASSASVLVRGLGAAPGAASGPVRVVAGPSEGDRLAAGDVLVAPMTTPDWAPMMRRAAAIVTDSGGMTCHAAIVSRELGVPCLVGTSEATRRLRDGELVTVDATRGVVLEGQIAATGTARQKPGQPAVAAAPVTGTRVLVNLSEPSQAERAAALPVDGVGLLRAELMVLEALEGLHPQVLLEQGRGKEFSQRMADGVLTFARAFSPRPITYRTIDFRTNEFRGLEGGERFEPEEANPMIGFRGALRYSRQPELFRLELAALGQVWDEGFENVHVMLPFVRTPVELAACVEAIESSGLQRRKGFELWVMAEVPSVLFHLERYAAQGIAGISIGSNDLTQLLLGADRDSELLADVFDERDAAVVAYLEQLIPRARSLELATSICGQAPSVHPEYAEVLVRAGIDAVSVTPDAVERTRRMVAAAEQRLLLKEARR